MDSSFAPSGRSERIGVSGVIPRRAGGPAFAAAGLGAGLALKPTAWPTIAVTCLAFESRIAAGPGVAVLHGNIPNLRAALDDAIGRGCSGIISFGIAGGLAPDLAPGAWVVASGVVAAHRRYPTDRDWARRLVHALGSAVHADIAGVDGHGVERGMFQRIEIWVRRYFWIAIITVVGLVAAAEFGVFAAFGVGVEAGDGVDEGVGREFQFPGEFGDG